MSKKRFVDTSFWSDPWVVDELNPLDRYLYLYLLTNEKTNIAGIYEISLRTISYETGIERDELLRMLNRLESRVVYGDGWMVVKNAIKNQNYHSPKIKRGIEMALAEAPPHLLNSLTMVKDWIPEVVKKETERQLLESDTVPIPSDTVYKLNDSDSDSDSDVSNKLLTGSYEPLAAEPAHDHRRQKTKEIDGMFEYWQGTVGYAITAKVKQNREYAGKMLNEYSKQEIAQGIHAAARASEERYAPRVANFIDLYRKWDDLKLWDKRQVRGKTGVTAI